MSYLRFNQDLAGKKNKKKIQTNVMKFGLTPEYMSVVSVLTALPEWDIGGFLPDYTALRPIRS